MKLALYWAIIALIALAIVALPGGSGTLHVVLSLLSMVFFVLIALFAVRLYRENQFTLDSMSDRQRWVLYGSIGLALLTFTATPRLFDTGIGVVVWLVLLGLASYGVMWVYMSYRQYS
jgi:drug/metabolite transporter (DMT)-like permease